MIGLILSLVGGVGGLGALAFFFPGSALLVAKAVWSFLCHRSFWQLMCIACVLFAGVQYLGKKSEQRHAHKLEQQLTKCADGRKADRDAYAKAQADAAAANKAHVQQIETEGRKVSDDEKQAYLRDHAELLRIRAEQLRGKTAQGAIGSTDPSSPPAPATGTDADELHLSADQYLQAQEIELKLMHLQDWVEKQLAVDPNAPPEMSKR